MVHDSGHNPTDAAYVCVRLGAHERFFHRRGCSAEAAAHPVYFYPMHTGGGFLPLSNRSSSKIGSSSSSRQHNGEHIR